MKKYLIFAALFMLAACGQKSATQSQSQDSAQTTDAPKYLSSDLQLFDLYGNVDSVTFHFHTDHFDANGRICTKGVTIERDAEGRIAKYEFGSIESIGDMWFVEEYKYDENGRVKERVHDCIFYSETAQFSYDEDGHLIHYDAKASAEGEEWERARDFEFLDYDEQGNWTKRRALADQEEDVIEDREIYYHK